MRSLLWGALKLLPLFFTIAVIYGMVGLFGKDFDMPVAVLSTLSLGLAIDFAVHFVGRFQRRHQECSRLEDSLVWTVARPGKGIFRNAILFALGFLVMVFADLTPYITVGVLMAAIMLLSSIASVVYLPILIRIFRKPLAGGAQRPAQSSATNHLEGHVMGKPQIGGRGTESHVQHDFAFDCRGFVGRGCPLAERACGWDYGRADCPAVARSLLLRRRGHEGARSDGFDHIRWKEANPRSHHAAKERS